MIAIIELYQHSEVIRHYCILLKNGDQQVRIYASSIVYQMLKDFHQHPNFQWIVKVENQSIDSFLKSNYESIQEAKLVFITTALNNFKSFYQLSANYKTILLVHNAHSFLDPQKFLDLDDSQNIWDRFRWLKIQANRSHYYKKQLLQNLVGLIFPTEIVLNYVKDHFTLPAHLELTALPFSAYEQQPPIVSKDRSVTITIPCTVNSEQRDYNLVLNVFKKIENNLSENINLVLLGKPKNDGHKIIAGFQAIASPRIKITAFKDTISHQEYEQWLQVSDFLILPLKPESKNHIYKERLGFSKISGGINDMIRHGTPALIPSYYPIDGALEKMIERFTEEDLSELLLHWINQKRYLIFKTHVDSALINYSVSKMQLEFHQKISRFLT